MSQTERESATSTGASVKSSNSKSQPSIISLLTVMLSISVIILAGLFTILLMIARDYLQPGSVLAHNVGEIGSPPLVLTSTSFGEVSKTVITPTPLQPLPTATITPTPTETPTQTPTATVTLTSTPVPPPPIPEPKWPPESAQISNIIGYTQGYMLDCESRSAVDWAAYFGVSIGELEFLNQLPRSDDPNLGFVGDPNGVSGLIPPDSYGVHAGPVARLLRTYGLPAEEKYGLSHDELKSEVASGRPVIAWVIVGTGLGYSLEYTTEAGEIVDVAPYEHTIIVIGYDSSGVTILDGGMVYWRIWDLFDASFAVLDNMAIIAR